MLSKENFADVRILELINKRTLQFNGIFGMSDDIVGNFDTKIKEVLQEFRHKDEVEQSFKDNLKEHKKTNEKITEYAEDVLFTTFSKSIIDKVEINPKYIEDKICPSKFRDKERERNLGVVTLKGEQPCGADDAAQGCDTRLDEENSYDNTDFYNRLSILDDLDCKIDKDKYIEEYISSKQGSYAYETEKLTMLAGRKKALLELSLKDLRTEIERMKKESKNTSTSTWDE